ncbi:MAG: peptide deformylase, partial [Rhodanobacter sp.]
YVHVDAPIDVHHAARTIPAHVAIVWDSSLSGRLRDHAAEFALLDAYFHAMGNGKVKLTLTRDGKEQTVEADGLLATCLQHEIDHLNGILFIDHIS